MERIKLVHQNRQEKVNRWAHPIRAVAFDMDGLMVNTEDLYTEVGALLLSRRGRTFTPALKKKMMGLPGQQAFALMIEHEQLDDSVATLATESDELFLDILPHRLEVLPGLLSLLDALDDRNLPRCVATSSPHHFAREVLGTVNLLARIDFVVTAEDVVHGKPYPDIYLEAARRMAVSSEQMLVLEDSHHGARAGVASGACTIAVPGSHSQDHDFLGVHFRANTLADPCFQSLLTSAHE